MHAKGLGFRSGSIILSREEGTFKMSLYPNLNDNLALSSDEEIGEFGSPEEYAVEEGDRSGCAYDGQRTNYSRTMAGSSVPGTGYASSVTPSPALKTASPNHPRAPNNVSGTLSLADFEENYLHRRHKEPSVNLSYGHRAPNRKQGRRRSIFKEVVDFFERTSRWKLALIGCVLGLLFAVVYSELQLGNSSKGMYTYVCVCVCPEYITTPCSQAFIS